MHLLVAFAKPFRMPDFFMISGLFLSLVIDRDWRGYLDRKVVHFAYFYVLWVTIQFGFKAPGFAANRAGPRSAGCIWNPSSSRSARCGSFTCCRCSSWSQNCHANCRPLLIWSVAALLEMAHVATGWTVIDEFCARFVYFHAGYLFAAHVFALSDRARARPARALAALAIWALSEWRARGDGAVSEWPCGLARGWALPAPTGS